MRAIRVHESGGIDTMRLDEIPRPVPGAGEVLVAVKAAGVGPWDRLVREGQSGLGQALPLTLGADVIAKESGASVYGTARIRDIERVRALGAEPIVEGDRVGVQLACRPLDPVIDTIGGDALESTCEALHPNGIIVSIVRPWTRPMSDRGACARRISSSTSRATGSTGSRRWSNAERSSCRSARFSTLPTRAPPTACWMVRLTSPEKSCSGSQTDISASTAPLEAGLQAHRPDELRLRDHTVSVSLITLRVAHGGSSCLKQNGSRS